MADCDVESLAAVLEEEILKPFVGDMRQANKAGIQKTMKQDRKSTRLNSSHLKLSRMPSSA